MTNKEKTNINTLLRLAAACFFCLAITMRLATSQTRNPSSTAKQVIAQRDLKTSTVAKENVQKLFSANKNIRIPVGFDFTRTQYEIERYIGSQMAQPRFWKNRDSEGSTLLAIQVLGTYGSEFVVPDLVNHIKFQVDPKTFRVGASRTVISLYPVASALSQIGGISVRRNVLQKLYRTEDEGELRLCVWVLNETEGANVAEFIVDSALQSVTQNVATEEVERAIINIKRAKTLIRNPNSLLDFSAVK